MTVRHAAAYVGSRAMELRDTPRGGRLPPGGARLHRAEPARRARRRAAPAASRTPTATGAASSARRATPGSTWPKEYGGAGAPYSHQAIFLEELARAEAPSHLGVIGLGMAGPTIIAWGTPEQKERYLSKILSAEEIWCQGFSEPDAGSDLAAVAHAHRGQGRPLPRQRPEGVVVVRAHRRLLHPRRARPARRAALQEPHLRDRRHARAGRRGAAARADHRPSGVQRDLLHRREGAEGEPPRRGRREAGRSR